MPLRFKCRCGTVLTVPTQRIGKSVRCPSCGETIVIPEPKKNEPTSKPQSREADQAKTDVRTDPAPSKPSPASETDTQEQPRPTSPTTPTTQATDKSKPASQSQQQRQSAVPEKKKADAPASSEAAPSKPPPLKTQPSPRAPATAEKTSESAPARPSIPPLPRQPSKIDQSKDEPETPRPQQKRKRSPKRKLNLTWKKGAAKRTADSDETISGVEHDPAKRWSAYYLAIGVIIVALFNIAPAFYEGFQAFRLEPPRPMARWAYAALVIGLVQMAYAFYLIQLPDWGSVWVVAILSLVATTIYAALVSSVILGNQDSQLLQMLQLNYVARKKAILWCTAMLMLSALLTYFCGRTGIRWHKAFSIAYPAKTTKTSPSSS